MCLKCEILSNTNKHNQPPANTCEMLSIDCRRHQKTQLLRFYSLVVSTNVTARNMYVWLLLNWSVGVCICLAISKLLCSIRVDLRTPRQTTSSLRASTSSHAHHHHQQLLLFSTSCKVLKIKYEAEAFLLYQGVCMYYIYVYQKNRRWLCLSWTKKSRRTLWNKANQHIQWSSKSAFILFFVK